MRAHGTIPLIIPWTIPLIIPPLPEEPSPVSGSLLLTWNPSFACGATPVHSGPRLFVDWPLTPYPFTPHSHFPPQPVPHSNYVPFYDDITTSTSYSLIQLYLSAANCSWIQKISGKNPVSFDQDILVAVSCSLCAALGRPQFWRRYSISSFL